MKGEAKFDLDEADIRQAIATMLIEKYGRVWQISPTSIKFTYDTPEEGKRVLSGAAVLMTSGRGTATQG